MEPLYFTVVVFHGFYGIWRKKKMDRIGRMDFYCSDGARSSSPPGFRSLGKKSIASPEIVLPCRFTTSAGLRVPHFTPILSSKYGYTLSTAYDAPRGGMDPQVMLLFVVNLFGPPTCPRRPWMYPIGIHGVFACVQRVYQ